MERDPLSKWCQGLGTTFNRYLKPRKASTHPGNFQKQEKTSWQVNIQRVAHMIKNASQEWYKTSWRLPEGGATWPWRLQAWSQAPLPKTWAARQVVNPFASLIIFQFPIMSDCVRTQTSVAGTAAPTDVSTLHLQIMSSSERAMEST